MVFDGIILSILVGFIRRGNLLGFAELKLRGALIFPLILFVQVFIFLFQDRWSPLEAVSIYIFMAVYIVGLYFLWLNRNLHGFLLIFAGVFLNFLVMAVNGGRMPVSLEAAQILDPMYIEVLKNGVYAKHTALTETTRLAFLGDVIPLNIPFRNNQVISIGDVFMNIGIFLFIQHLMLSHKKDIFKEAKAS
ncbi:hypothetical protein J2S74_000510 [Evansella vedderi]|uniref:DUF5317 domain-containing protein n=1 Tax=Evansella vedderi TaxID=38282 RepID=A0ABT9ZPH2_9BACI|nr:DUF5317 domain-containing protein [Evansella vedderi]MDQ0253138.1 hypothetical protein [Evansella vedderi]